MHIFIDESGNFVFPKNKISKISCVAALTIPDNQYKTVENSYISLRKTWGHENEVKGSKLTEKQISDTIALLRSHESLVDIVCIDIGHHTPTNVAKFKKIQSDKLIENLTSEHHEKLVAQLNEYKERMLNLPNQLFIQAIISIVLFQRVLDHSTLYFCQRIPEELGNFFWYIDAKNINSGKTPFEELWSTLLGPILQWNYSMGVFEEGDYSYFKKYEISREEMSDFHRAIGPEDSLGGVDIKKLINENLHFEDSSVNIGLQLVDIVSSAFNRAMNGNLKAKGWRHLGMLMVKEPSIVILGDDKMNDPVISKRHSLIIKSFRKKHKAMLLN